MDARGFCIYKNSIYNEQTKKKVKKTFLENDNSAVKAYYNKSKTNVEHPFIDTGVPIKEVYLVYKTDTLHSYNSRDIIGVALSPAEAVKICKAKAKKEGHKITDEQLWNLENLKQTQGYEGEGEFHYEALATNTLL